MVEETLSLKEIERRAKILQDDNFSRKEEVIQYLEGQKEKYGDEIVVIADGEYSVKDLIDEIENETKAGKFTYMGVLFTLDRRNELRDKE